MKNEKFCFSKGTGLIALVGVLLVGFVMFTQAANQPTSSNTKAAPPSAKCTYGTLPVSVSGTANAKYTYDTTTFCISENKYDAAGAVLSTTLKGARCRYTVDAAGAKTFANGNAVNDASCNPTPAAKVFSYMGHALPWTDAAGKEYAVDGDNCLTYGGAKTGMIGDATTFKYTTATSGVCALTSSSTRTAYSYMGHALPWTDAAGKEYAVDGDNCLTYGGAKTGMIGNATTFKFTSAAAGSTCAAVRLGAVDCSYGTKPVSVAGTAGALYTYDTTTFCISENKYDAAGAVLSTTLKGARCRYTVDAAGAKTFAKGNAVNDASCNPAAAVRTSCAINGVALADAATPGTVGAETYGAEATYAGKKYQLESPTDCVVYADTKINQGLWCDRANGFTMKYNASKCSTTP